MAGRPDLVMLEPKRHSQPLVPPVLPVFYQVLNLHRSLLPTCTEEPYAELIHPGAADLRLPVPPVAAAGPGFLSPELRGGQLQVLPDAVRRRMTEYKTCARQPQLSRHVRLPAGPVHHHGIPASSPESYGCS